jgi:hypothetical protein
VMRLSAGDGEGACGTGGRSDLSDPRYSVLHRLTNRRQDGRARRARERVTGRRKRNSPAAAGRNLAAEHACTS